ncbi:MAG: hypothetical protein LBD23_10975 [Oscillospiraceae bacterium]|nr:hypothetical protein [Oscillospiraceae bacterium]
MSILNLLTFLLLYVLSSLPRQWKKEYFCKKILFDLDDGTVILIVLELRRDNSLCLNS